MLRQVVESIHLLLYSSCYAGFILGFQRHSDLLRECFSRFILHLLPFHPSCLVSCSVHCLLIDSPPCCFLCFWFVLLGILCSEIILLFILQSCLRIMAKQVLDMKHQVFVEVGLANLGASAAMRMLSDDRSYQ